MTLGKKNEPSEVDEDEEFELDVDYDPSSLTLDQSIMQVFNIINSVKLPSIEKQQLQALQGHINKMMFENTDMLGKRHAKSARKAILKRPFQFEEACDNEGS